jgi:hypothetical protein
VRVVPSVLFERAQLIGAAAYWRGERMLESAGPGAAEQTVAKNSIAAP